MGTTYNISGEKVKKVFYTLRFIRKYATENLRIRLIQALVTFHLDYCSAFLLDVGVGLEKEFKDLAASVLDTFLVLKRTLVSPLTEKIILATTDARIFYFCNIIIYKILRMNQPNYLTQ